MNKSYINIAIYAILIIATFVTSNRAMHYSRQSEYWHGRYDQSVSAQKRTDSIAGVYQTSIVVLADSASKRAIAKETTSTVTANKITNTSKPRK